MPLRAPVIFKVLGDVVPGQGDRATVTAHDRGQVHIEAGLVRISVAVHSKRVALDITVLLVMMT